MAARVTVLTTASGIKDQPGWSVLCATASQFGYSVHVMQAGEAWKGVGSKISILKEFVNGLTSSEELLLFVDAFDVSFCASAQQMAKMYRDKIESKEYPENCVIFGGETCCWPLESLTQQLINKLNATTTTTTTGTTTTTPSTMHNPFPNSGVLLGTVEGFQGIFANDTSGGLYTWDDQLWWQQQYLQQPGRIVLDARCEFIQCLGPEGDSVDSQVEFRPNDGGDGEGGRRVIAFNKLHGTFPCIVHANGDQEVRRPWLQQYQHILDNNHNNHKVVLTTIINLPRRAHRRDFMLFNTLPTLEALHEKSDENSLCFVYLWIKAVDAAANPPVLATMKESPHWFKDLTKIQSKEPCPYCEVDAGLSECFHFRHMKPGEFGCTASHLVAWDVSMHWFENFRFAEFLPFALFLEDDATLVEDAPKNFLSETPIGEVECHYFACRTFSNAPGYRYWTAAYGLPWHVVPKFQTRFAQALKENSIPLDEAFCVLADTFPFRDLCRVIRDSWNVNDWVMTTAHSSPIRPFTQLVIDQLHDTETHEDENSGSVTSSLLSTAEALRRAISESNDLMELRLNLLTNGQAMAKIPTPPANDQSNDNRPGLEFFLNELLCLTDEYSVEPLPASRLLSVEENRFVWLDIKPEISAESGEGSFFTAIMSYQSFEKDQQGLHMWQIPITRLLPLAVHLADSLNSTLVSQWESTSAVEEFRSVADICQDGQMVDTRLAKAVQSDLLRQIENCTLRSNKKRYVDTTYATPRAMQTLSYEMLLEGRAGFAGLIACRLYYTLFADKLQRLHSNLSPGERIFASPCIPERIVLNLQMEEGDTHGGHFDDDPYAVVWCIHNVDKEEGGTTEIFDDSSLQKRQTPSRSVHLSHNSGIFFRGDNLFHRVSPLQIHRSVDDENSSSVVPKLRLVFAMVYDTQNSKSVPACHRPSVQALYL